MVVILSSFGENGEGVEGERPMQIELGAFLFSATGSFR